MISIMDRVFIDSNIWIYAFISTENLNEKDLIKHDSCIRLLENLYHNQAIIVSTQVINEVHYTLIRKYKFDDDKVKKIIEYGLLAISELVIINKDTYDKSFTLRQQNNFSFWDSLIISSAIENRTSILYSEDMQHNQIINKRLKIINPFDSTKS
jgi:predicted nucleic acid-binding protein